MRRVAHVSVQSGVALPTIRTVMTVHNEGVVGHSCIVFLGGREDGYK